MERQSVQAPDAARALTFAAAGGEEARNRQEGFFRYGGEGDPEVGVVVAPRGRAEERGVECLPRPGDSAIDLEDPSRRQSQHDVDRFARGETFRRGDP